MTRCLALFLVALALVALPASAQTAPPAAQPTPPPAAVAPAPVAPSVPLVYLDKMVVVVDGKAEYNGSLQLEFTPLGGQARLVEVRLLAKSKKKDIAKDIYKELSLAAGATYKVKLNGEEVKISKGTNKTPKFSLVVKSLAVPGVSVRVDKG